MRSQGRLSREKNKIKSRKITKKKTTNIRRNKNKT